jgi:type III secretion system low calcium response chaperone LcrH/SycD
MGKDSVIEMFGKLVEHIARSFLKGDITLAELLELDDSEIQMIFMLGNYLYNYGKYQPALNIFSMLTVYKPFVSKYWRAAGAANQALKKYNEAITAYDMALSTNAYDAVSYTYRGESKLAAGREAEGVEDLKQAIQVGGVKPVYAQWVNRSKTLLRVRKIAFE